jgi:hypothetical protein
MVSGKATMKTYVSLTFKRASKTIESPFNTKLSIKPAIIDKNEITYNICTIEGSVKDTDVIPLVDDIISIKDEISTHLGIYYTELLFTVHNADNLDADINISHVLLRKLINFGVCINVRIFNKEKQCKLNNYI